MKKNKAEIADAFVILGVNAATPPDMIHRAYRRLVKRWHPDQFAQNSADRSYAESRLKLINQAYGVIKAHLRTQAPSSSPPKNERPFSGPFTWHKTFFQGIFGHTGPHRAASSHPNQNRPSPRQPQRPPGGFQQVLHKAHSHQRVFKTATVTPSQPAKTVKRYPQRPRRKGGMRIEPMEPFSKIRPVSPISPIGDDD